MWYVKRKSSFFKKYHRLAVHCYCFLRTSFPSMVHLFFFWFGPKWLWVVSRVKALEKEDFERCCANSLVIRDYIYIFFNEIFFSYEVLRLKFLVCYFIVPSSLYLSFIFGDFFLVAELFLYVILTKQKNLVMIVFLALNITKGCKHVEKTVKKRKTCFVIDLLMPN